MKQNDRQVGGEHYKSPIQHWDYVWANDLDYFQAQIIKYVTRWKAKNGLEDLAKARHFLEKYMELQLGIEAEGLSNCGTLGEPPFDEGEEPTENYVNQDKQPIGSVCSECKVPHWEEHLDTCPLSKGPNDKC